MQVLVLMASSPSAGDRSRLSPGDRAALHWGMTLSGGECDIRCPDGDRVAWTYASAQKMTPAVPNSQTAIPPDLILIGPGACERWGDELAGQLAEEFSAELCFDVLNIEKRDPLWTVECDAGRGAKDILQVTGPLIAVLSNQVARSPYVSQYRLSQAARFVPKNPASDDDIPAWRSVAPRPRRITGLSAAGADDRTNSVFGIANDADRERRASVIADTPRACAEVLLRYLVSHRFVMRALPTDAAKFPSASSSVDAPTSRAVDSKSESTDLSAALRRSPRCAIDQRQRLSRRPRRTSETIFNPEISSYTALQRGPRRLSDGKPAGERGPFRLPSTLPTSMTRDD